jgi:hypothetical protein
MPKPHPKQRFRQPNPGNQTDDLPMTKGTQLWPNERMRDFFLAHIRRETSLPDGDAARLTDALLKAVNRMLVWETPAAGPDANATVAPKVKAGAKPAETKAPDAATATGKKAAVHPAPAQPMHNSSGAKVGAAAKPAFDPYAFSVTVVLAKTGRDGLMKRLTEIKSVDQLKTFADAQHLGLDRKLTKIDDLRKAILAAAEQRLADRRAAAS